METQTAVKKSTVNRTILNLIVDSLLFLLFLVVYQEKATGIALHEWLGVGIIVVIITHILLNWPWVVSVTKRFLHKMHAEPRIDYIVDMAIFISFTTAIFSGLMMSRTVLPFLGLESASESTWKMLHSTSSEVTVWLTALHVALHWHWIVNAVKHYVVMPIGQFFRPLFRHPETESAPAKEMAESQQ